MVKLFNLFSFVVLSENVKRYEMSNDESGKYLTYIPNSCTKRGLWNIGVQMSEQIVDNFKI